MAQFHREIGKLFASYSNKITSTAPAQYVPSPPVRGKLRRALSSALMPIWFKFFRGPLDRWNLAVMAKYLRDHGLMYDDMYSDKEPVFARALELLPHDIRVARYRRLMRGANLNHLRMYLPLHEQNYDPFIPYMAPYVEEAKFQLQEEEELLGYHMWEGVWYSGGVTGFGDKEPGEHFLLAAPNLYGAGGSTMQLGGKHFSTRASSALRARLVENAERKRIGVAAGEGGEKRKVAGCNGSPSEGAVRVQSSPPLSSSAIGEGQERKRVQSCEANDLNNEMKRA